MENTKVKKMLEKDIKRIEGNYKYMFCNVNLDWTFDRYVEFIKMRDKEIAESIENHKKLLIQ